MYGFQSMEAAVRKGMGTMVPRVYDVNGGDVSSVKKPGNVW